MQDSKFKINNVKLLSFWTYNLKHNTDCTVCRCNLNANSIYAQDKGSESFVVSGVCGHSFHHECIDPWIKINPICPICSTKWTYLK
jgi:RING-box protein 1